MENKEKNLTEIKNYNITHSDFSYPEKIHNDSKINYLKTDFITPKGEYEKVGEIAISEAE